MLWGLAALLLLGLAVQQKKRPKVSEAVRARNIALVRAEAHRQGVAEPIALAFAEAESDFDDGVEGDLDWATKKPDKYESLVLRNPKLAKNPARLDARAWHSYGLFQLLAAHHVRPSEHPRALLDPALNAQRGVTYIKGLLRKHGDDVAQARLAYTGALTASQDVKDKVLERFAPIYQRWHEHDAGGLA